MRACTQAGRRTERGDERATGWNDGAASGGRNRGAMVAALSAADHDRAVLGRQFDRRSRGARSVAARGAGLLALGDRAGAAAAAPLAPLDREPLVYGKGVSVLLDLGGLRTHKKK